MDNNNEFALIVAAGDGERFGGNRLKQFVALDGLPVVMHTINAFVRYSPSIRVVLVVAGKSRDLWTELCAQYDFRQELMVANGGPTRYDSVKNGLAVIDGPGLVAIHDGVRPLIREELIAASFKLAAVHGSAVAAVRLKESIRTVDKDTTRTVDRSRYRLVQTPQTFKVDLIKNAYSKVTDSKLTDDATVAELAGHTISLFEGSYDNIKITTPEDLAVAERLIALRRA